MSGLPGGFHLRLAERDDAALLHDIMLRCWTGTVASNSSAYRETMETIASQLERGGGIILYEGDQPIGAGRFYPVAGPDGDLRPWGEIKRVGILKPYRKRGLGAPLVDALEAECRRRGYAGVQIGVRADQPRVTEFWSGLGYRLAGDVTLHTANPLAPPPTTMRKWLQP